MYSLSKFVKEDYVKQILKISNKMCADSRKGLSLYGLMGYYACQREPLPELTQYKGFVDILD